VKREENLKNLRRGGNLENEKKSTQLSSKEKDWKKEEAGPED